MRKALALCLVLASTSGLRAEGLQGRWKITDPADATYSGNLVVDAQGRAVVAGANASSDSKGMGYVERAGSNVSIVLTDRKVVSRIRCVLQSRDILNCETSAYGIVSGMYYMRRQAPSPDEIVMQGRWKIPHRNLTAEVAVDAQRQAVLTTRSSAGEAFKETGFVWIDGSKVEIIFTDRTDRARNNPDHLRCVVQSSDLLSCVNILTKSTAFFVTRITDR